MCTRNASSSASSSTERVYIAQNRKFLKVRSTRVPHKHSTIVLCVYIFRYNISKYREITL